MTSRCLRRCTVPRFSSRAGVLSLLLVFLIPGTTQAQVCEPNALSRDKRVPYVDNRPSTKLVVPFDLAQSPVFLAAVTAWNQACGFRNVPPLDWTWPQARSGRPWGSVGLRGRNEPAPAPPEETSLSHAFSDHRATSCWSVAPACESRAQAAMPKPSLRPKVPARCEESRCKKLEVGQDRRARCGRAQ